MRPRRDHLGLGARQTEHAEGAGGHFLGSAGAQPALCPRLHHGQHAAGDRGARDELIAGVEASFGHAAGDAGAQPLDDRHRAALGRSQADLQNEPHAGEVFA